VLKYMAEKPDQVLAEDARDQVATPAGALTSPLPTAQSATGNII
jgi:cytochrome bd ubiquinol oxidase subunit I